MKLLDRYIIRKFLTTFVFAILLIIMIAIVFDITEKLDDFISKSAPLNLIVFEYYLNFIPYFANLFSPLFTFIAVIYFTAKMAQDTEIVAILTSGISFKRFLRPYMIAATLLAAMSYYLNNYVIPRANVTRLAFENKYINNRFYNGDINIHLQVKPGEYIYMESYNTLDNLGNKFSYEKIKDNKLYYKLMSDNIQYDTVIKKWKVQNYTIRTIDGMHETLRKGLRLDTTYRFYPADFSTRTDNVKSMDKPTLDAFIAKEKMKGSEDVPYYELEKYQRASLPFATFILTLIGVSMASRKVRGGIGLHIGLGLLISFSYILFMQISSTFATNGNLSPFIAVWIPNVLYFFIALVLLRLAPK